MQDHWLVRPTTIRMLWVVFLGVLAATVAADLFVDSHAVFGIDGTFGFAAWYGFASCVILVGGAKLLGFVLKRSDTYYEGRQ